MSDEATGVATSDGVITTDIDGGSPVPDRTEIDVLRTVGLVLQDDVLAALPIAEFILRQEVDPALARIASTVRRLGYWKLGDFKSYGALQQSHRQDPAEGRFNAFNVFDLSIDAAVELGQLRLSSAERFARDALKLSVLTLGRAAAPTAVAASVFAQILYEQGRLDEAECVLQGRLEPTDGLETVEGAIRIHVTLAKIAMHRKKREVALGLLRDGEALGEARGWARLSAACLGERLGLLVEDGDVCGASACLKLLQAVADRPRALSGPARHDVDRELALGVSRLSLAKGLNGSSVATIRQLRRDAIGRCDLYGAAGLAVRLADALVVVDDVEGAAEMLGRALEIGASTGLQQTFVDGGLNIGRLLALIHERTHDPEDGLHARSAYIGGLLARWRDCQIAREARARTMGIGRLSPRERRVLQLMGRGLSNKRIALELAIAPETVKSHVKHIFVKMDARTRADAIAFAETMDCPSPLSIQGHDERCRKGIVSSSSHTRKPDL